MADLSRAAQNSVALQREMFRLAERDHGLSVKILSQTRDIAYNTLRSWANGTQMPAWALGQLDLPDDLVSLVLAPFERHIVADTVPDSDGDLDALAKEVAAYSVDYLDARDPSGDGGMAITPRERARLLERCRTIAARAIRILRRAN